MAVAKKCDICGKFYELYNVKNDSKNTNGFMFLNINDERKYFAHDAIDCCSECMRSIRNHIDLLKNGGCSDKKAGD